MKILVVDDEPVKCKFYKEEFEDEGYEVITAIDGEEAIRLFKTESPDLVTLDIAMPSTTEKEGLKILREMKKIKQDVPVILLTAFDFTDDLRTWAADRYIMKSADSHEIKMAISELLKTKGLSTQIQYALDKLIELERRVLEIEKQLGGRKKAHKETLQV